MFDLDECKQIISDHLKDQPDRNLSKMLANASLGKMAFEETSTCLLGMSRGGYSRAKAEAIQKYPPTIHIYTDFPDFEAPKPEAAFYYLHPRFKLWRSANGWRNRLLVPLIEAEIQRRAALKTSAPPVDSPPVEAPADPLEPAEPQPVSDSELVELFS